MVQRVGAAWVCTLALCLLPGCAVMGPALGGPHPLAQVRHLGLAFVGDPDVAVPARLQPGAAGEAAVTAQGVAAGLIWMPGWLIGGPLWVPGVYVAGEAACRDAVNADPERVPALRQRLADWPAMSQLNQRLADRIPHRAPSRTALTPTDPAGLLAEAAARRLQAIALFNVQRIEVRTDSHGGACAMQLFVRGKIRALRAPDGALLEWQPVPSDRCKGNATLPLAQALRDGGALDAAMQSAIDCAVSELIEWTDLPWSTY